MELPVARRTIALWKILALVVEVTGLLILVIPAFIPWGINIDWGAFGFQLLLIWLFSIAGILLGLLLDALIYRIFSSGSVSKFVSYLFALMLFAATILSRTYTVSLSTGGMTVVCGAAIIVFELFIVSWAILARFDSIDFINSKRIKRQGTSGWGSFALAIARKEIVHYWREAGQLLQLLVISVVLILVLSQIGSMGPMVTRVLLLGIPYSFAGIITLHLTGSDGIIMTLIKLCKGSLQGYYGVRSLFSCVFVLMPSVLAYSVLALCFFRQGLGLSYFGALIFVCLFSVAMASGISVVFKKEAPNPLLPVRGTSVLGELFYWIVGIGPVLHLAMWIPIPSAILNVPTGFNILAVVALSVSIGMWIIGICRVDMLN